MQQQMDDEVEIEKSIISWWTNRNRKTLVAKTIAKMLDVPLVLLMQLY
jgi:ATP-dependent protease Clp ATPase subunit